MEYGAALLVCVWLVWRTKNILSEWRKGRYHPKSLLFTGFGWLMVIAYAADFLR